MASVSSLDKDLRKLRSDKYTPRAANEAREWIESTLGTRLPSGDLLEALKDGVALCQLINQALPSPTLRFKQSAMPFVQMENISQFLRACKNPPFNLPDHDLFLTVDLYESKDPAQVLQCLGAFSRAAHNSNPQAVPTSIGPRTTGRGMMSPQSTGSTTPTGIRGRGGSTASNTSSIYGTRPGLSPTKTGDSNSGRWSPTKSPTQNGTKSPSTSSWSNKSHEGTTSPAWNIAQYGYMGGASQGNLGIAFGGRRQITSAGPNVPSLAEKEKRRKDKLEEEERQRQQMEEESARRKAEFEAEEARRQQEEERRWEVETRKARDREERKVAEEQRRWEEQEREWTQTEEKRRREEEEAEAQLKAQRTGSQAKSDSRLQGQFLSQYQAEQPKGSTNRVRDLEKQLEQARLDEARQREADYEQQRQDRLARQDSDPKAKVQSQSRPRPAAPERTPSRQDSWSRDEREVLKSEWEHEQKLQAAAKAAASPPPLRSARPLPTPAAAPAAAAASSPAQPQLPLRQSQPQSTEKIQQTPPPPPRQSQPQRAEETQTPQVTKHNTGSARPLPNPATYANQSTPASTTPHQQAAPSSSNRTDRYLASNPAPAPRVSQPTYSRELDATSERDAEDRRRAQSQQQTKAGGWGSKSLLEREMENERQRQREWEESQEETAKAARTGDGVEGIGGGIGGRWDVGQWSSYTGGDGQNKGSQGIGAGRRQIVGPRPLPGSGSGSGR